jgi:hypothetical protein
MAPWPPRRTAAALLLSLLLLFSVAAAHAAREAPAAAASRRRGHAHAELQEGQGEKVRRSVSPPCVHAWRMAGSATPQPLLIIFLCVLQPLQVVVDGELEEAIVGFTATKAETEKDDDDDPCGGGAGGAEQEECLMRRTLAAHTDYIYTQGGGHN